MNFFLNYYLNTHKNKHSNKHKRHQAKMNFKSAEALQQKQIELLIAKLCFEMERIGFSDDFCFSQSEFKSAQIIVWKKMQHPLFKEEFPREIGKVNIGWRHADPDGFLLWKFTKEHDVSGSPEDFVRWLLHNIRIFSEYNPTETQSHSIV